MNMLPGNLDESAVRNAPAGIAVFGIDGRFLRANPAFCRQIGYSQQELQTMTLDAITYADDHDLGLRLNRRLLNREMPSYSMDRRCVHKSGSVLRLWTGVSLVFDADGKPQYFVMYSIELQNSQAGMTTPLADAENSAVSCSRDDKALDASSAQKVECFYENILENFPDAVMLKSYAKWEYMTQAAVKLFGCESKEDFMNRDWLAFIHPDYREAVLRAIGRSSQGERTEPTEIKIIRKDGRSIDVELHCIPAYCGGETIVQTILRDITEQKKTQELLQNSEKLSVAGQLAAGIAHEIRNPLTSLKGFLQLLRSGVKDKEQYYTIMNSEIDRIELILNELLVLAKPQITKIEKRDVRVLLDRVVTLLDTQAILSNVQIRTVTDSDTFDIDCDENQLKQVFINFTKNAIEAMPEGGELVIEIMKHDRNRMRIRFIDQGCGIPADQLSRLGEPFYTTKEKGTGLGLMICRKIVENHRGTLHISSKPGEGTIIELLLPISSDEHIH